MDPAYMNKKIVDLTDAELIALGFMGESVPQGVKSVVAQVRADPDNLGSVTCFMVDCFKRKAEVPSRSQDTPQPPDSPPTSPTSSASSATTQRLTPSSPST